MKKSSFKSVCRKLYIGGCDINDSSFNALNDITRGYILIDQYWEMFYDPINSRVFDSRILLSTLDL